MNKSDSERIAAILDSVGYTPTANENDADLIIVNACSVRQSAVDRVFGQAQKFSGLEKKNPKFKVGEPVCHASNSNVKMIITKVSNYDSNSSIEYLCEWIGNDGQPHSQEFEEHVLKEQTSSTQIL